MRLLNVVDFRESGSSEAEHKFQHQREGSRPSTKSALLFIPFVILLLIVPGLVFADDVAVTNWPGLTNPLPVTLTDVDSVNVFPSFSLGLGFGFTVCGFGWVLRFAKRTANDHS